MLTSTDLPVGTPPKLRQAVMSLEPARREAFIEHLLGGTSADYLADWMKRAGHPVGATTIKTFRANMRSTSE